MHGTHARLSRRPMPPSAVGVGLDDFLVLSYCLKAEGFYHGPVVTRATPELTYAFAAYTTTNSFSVNTRGVARAAGLLAQQCRRHIEALQYTQPPLYRH